jgi:hypothetical protein
MFISITRKGRTYTIVDSDFTETISYEHNPIGGCIAVIDVYEKRNLNVAQNIIKCFLYQSKHQNFSIKGRIEWNKVYNPKFAKYENDLQKYLVLI